MARLLHGVGLRAVQFTSAAQFWDDPVTESCGCLVAELLLTPHGGLEILAEVRRRQSFLPVIIVASSPSVASAVRAMQLGAFQYYSKPVDPHELVGTVQAALRLSHQMQHTRQRLNDLRDKWSSLTKREREVLGLVTHGRSSKMLANELGISHKTAENYRARLMEKLGATNVAHLVRLALAGEVALDADRASHTAAHAAAKQTCSAARLCPALQVLLSPTI